MAHARRKRSKGGHTGKQIQRAAARNRRTYQQIPGHPLRDTEAMIKRIQEDAQEKPPRSSQKTEDEPRA